MRNIIYLAIIIILGAVSSLTMAEYTGSSDVGDSNDRYAKSGFESSYNSGFVGEYAGHISGGKALGELHSYGAEQGNQYDARESHQHDGYGQQNDGENKFSGGHYDGYTGDLDLSKFPLDAEAHYYTGKGAPTVGSGDELRRQKEKQSINHQEYQSDEDGDQAEKQQGYSNFENVQKQPDYKGGDYVSMHIVPYSNFNGAEHQNDGSHYTYNRGYESTKSPSPSYSPSYESSKESSTSYSSSYQSPKAPSPSYSPSYESSKESSTSYSSSYQSPKASNPSYSPAYESSKESSTSYSSSYQSPKAPSPSYSPSYESSKESSTSYSSSYKSPKAPSPTYNSLYEAAKTPTPTYSSHYVTPKTSTPSYSPSYELVKQPIVPIVPEDYSVTKSDDNSNENFGYLGEGYHYAPAPVTDTPSKPNAIHQVPNADFKNFHQALHKSIMTIDHGKGSYSYSSLYRS